MQCSLLGFGFVLLVCFIYPITHVLNLKDIKVKSYLLGTFHRRNFKLMIHCDCSFGSSDSRCLSHKYCSDFKSLVTDVFISDKGFLTFIQNIWVRFFENFISLCLCKHLRCHSNLKASSARSAQRNSRLCTTSATEGSAKSTNLNHVHKLSLFFMLM